jgi:hypothetical protein
MEVSARGPKFNVQGETRMSVETTTARWAVAERPWAAKNAAPRFGERSRQIQLRPRPGPALRDEPPPLFSRSPRPRA